MIRYKSMSFDRVSKTELYLCETIILCMSKLKISKKKCNHTISSCYRMSRQIRTLTLLDSTVLNMKLEKAFQLNKRYLWITRKAPGVNLGPNFLWDI